jgi:hypothetical protein
MSSNPESVENIGGTIAPHNATNREGNPVANRPGGDAPSTQPNTDSKIGQDYPGAKESTPALEGSGSVPGGGGRVVMGPSGDSPADTRANCDFPGDLGEFLRPTTLVEQAENGGHTKLNTPSGDKPRPFMPGEGLRGLIDTAVASEIGVDGAD